MVEPSLPLIESSDVRSIELIPGVERPIEREYRHFVFDNRRWQHFVPHPDDIFVCTPPKCGTTWMQSIVVELLFPGGAPGPVLEISPWVDARFEPVDTLMARLDAQPHRRTLKTHTPADGIPWYPSASYLVVGRDGRDAFMSYWNHYRNMRRDHLMHLVATAAADGSTVGVPPVEDLHEFFWWWLDEFQLWFTHVLSFWSHRGEQNVLFTHYNDLQADLDGEMRRVAGFLGVPIDAQRWSSQVEHCTFGSMKARSNEIGSFDRMWVGGAETFLYKATNGRWRDVLTDDELAAFDCRCEERLPADALAWTLNVPTER
jgi:aryl sulfotransferase